MMAALSDWLRKPSPVWLTLRLILLSVTVTSDLAWLSNWVRKPVVIIHLAPTLSTTMETSSAAIKAISCLRPRGRLQNHWKIEGLRPWKEVMLGLDCISGGCEVLRCGTIALSIVNGEADCRWVWSFLVLRRLGRSFWVVIEAVQNDRKIEKKTNSCAV